MAVVAAGVAVGGSLLTSAIGGSAQSDAINSGKAEANALSQQTIQEGRDNLGYDRGQITAGQGQINSDRGYITDDRTLGVENRNALLPYATAGTGAVQQYNDLLGLNGQDAATAAMGNFQASPGYDYQVQQGLRAVDAGAAAKGLLRSGATLKAEQTLGSNLANQDFGNYLGRLNSLATTGLQGQQLGLTSTGQTIQSTGQALTADSLNNQLIGTGVTATGSYNGLLSGQSSGQQATDTSAATANASIYGNEAKGIGNALNGGLNNTTYGAGGTSGLNSLFGLAGGYSSDGSIYRGR